MFKTLYLLLFVLLASCSTTNTVTINNYVFNVEVARTFQQKETGLMFRTVLPSDSAMIFLFDDDSGKDIWMRNCKIPLDVIWIDAQGQVVDIKENVPPCTENTLPEECPHFGGLVSSRHFIEFSAGTIAKVKIKLGDILYWDLYVPQEGYWFLLP